MQDTKGDTTVAYEDFNKKLPGNTSEIIDAQQLAKNIENQVQSIQDEIKRNLEDALAAEKDDPAAFVYTETKYSEFTQAKSYTNGVLDNEYTNYKQMEKKRWSGFTSAVKNFFTGADRAGNDETAKPSGDTAMQKYQREIPEFLKPDFVTLGIPFDFDARKIKSHYKKLVKKNHPDRYANDPVKMKEKTQLLSKINASYNRIEAWYADNDN
jgi:hypothetical protein